MADPKEFTLPDLLTFQTMYLCGVAYMADPALMPGMFKKTQVPPPGTAIWKCLWGPVQNDDDANLAFVAGYFPDPNAAPESVFITIRGTDVDIDDIWGFSGRPRRPRSAADAVGAQRSGACRLWHARWPHDHSGTGRLHATPQPRN